MAIIILDLLKIKTNKGTYEDGINETAGIAEGYFYRGGFTKKDCERLLKAKSISKFIDVLAVALTEGHVAELGESILLGLTEITDVNDIVELTCIRETEEEDFEEFSGLYDYRIKIDFVNKTFNCFTDIDCGDEEYDEDEA